MSAEDFKAVVRGFLEEVSKGKTVAFAAIDRLFAVDYVEHGGSGEAVRGIKNYKHAMDEFYSAVPDVHVTVNDVVVEGDKVAVRFTLSGTHRGEFAGAPPTGNKVMIEEIGIIRIVGGKFVESWMRYDTLGFMQQLGLVPISKK